MSILDKLQTQNLHHRRPVYDPLAPNGPMLSIERDSASLDPRHNGYTYETAYRTTLKYEVVWYANSAQLSSRRDLAEKELLHGLYDPVFNRLRSIRSAAADRDFERVMLMCDDIEAAILGDDR